MLYAIPNLSTCCSFCLNTRPLPLSLMISSGFTFSKKPFLASTDWSSGSSTACAILQFHSVLIMGLAVCLSCCCGFLKRAGMYIFHFCMSSAQSGIWPLVSSHKVVIASWHFSWGLKAYIRWKGNIEKRQARGGFLEELITWLTPGGWEGGENKIIGEKKAVMRPERGVLEKWQRKETCEGMQEDRLKTDVFGTDLVEPLLPYWGAWTTGSRGASG